MQIFISYSRADWLYVQQIAHALRRRGIATWVDIENILPGEKWEPTVGRAISDSAAFIFCVSPLCIESRHTSKELLRAIATGKEIFPVMIEKVDVSLLPAEVRERQILEVWRHSAKVGAEKVSQTIAVRLDFDALADGGQGSDADQTIELLLLHFGRVNYSEARRKICAQLGVADQDVVERWVRSVEDFPLVEQFVGTARSVYVVLGDDTSVDAFSLVLGAVLGGGGRSKLCLLYSPSQRAFVQGMAVPLKVRCVEFDLY